MQYFQTRLRADSVGASFILKALTGTALGCRKLQNYGASLKTKPNCILKGIYGSLTMNLNVGHLTAFKRAMSNK